MGFSHLFIMTKETFKARPMATATVTAQKQLPSTAQTVRILIPKTSLTIALKTLVSSFPSVIKASLLREMGLRKTGRADKAEERHLSMSRR